MDLLCLKRDASLGSPQYPQEIELVASTTPRELANKEDQPQLQHGLDDIFLIESH